jgi:hypothetical protein
MNRELFHSVVGTFAPILGVLTSLQEQIEYGLRISGLVVGLLAGLISLWQIPNRQGGSRRSRSRQYKLRRSREQIQSCNLAES